MARPTDVPTDVHSDSDAGEPTGHDAGEPTGHDAGDGSDDPVTEPVEGAPARGWKVFAIAGWALALIAVIAAATFATWWAPLHVEANEREAVRSTARELALRLTTFEGAQIEEWVAATQELSTGDYADEVTRLFDQEFRDALRDADAVSRGELIDLFVQDIDGDEALAFAVVRQTIANRHLADPVEDELRMEISLERVDDEWLVSNVAVMPSAGGGPQPAPAPGLEEDE